MERCGFVCVDCRKNYDEEEEICHHLAHECGMKLRIECPECSFITVREEALESHLVRKHGFLGEQGAAYLCVHCGDGFSTSDDIEGHLRICSKINPVKQDFTFLDCGVVKSEIETQELEDESEESEEPQESQEPQETSVPVLIFPDIQFPSTAPSKGDSGSSYKCNNCNQSIKTKRYLTEHMTFCGRPPTQKCPVCGHLTHLPGTLRWHIKHYHGAKAYQNYQLQKRLQLRATVDFPCPHCDKGYYTESGLNRHLKRDFCGQPRKCPECAFESGVRADLWAHIRRLHGQAAVDQFKQASNTNGTPKECKTCGRSFSTDYQLERHEKEPCKSTVQCPECPKRYSCVPAMKTHLGRAHGPDALQKFSLNKSELLFKCKQCGLTFNQKSDLETHQKDNCGQEPKQSCPECPYETHSRFTLNRHIVKKHGKDALANVQRPAEDDSFDCSVCGLSYGSKGSYLDHSKYCNKPPTQHCPECDYVTHRLNNLHVHIERRHGLDSLESFKNQNKKPTEETASYISTEGTST